LKIRLHLFFVERLICSKMLYTQACKIFEVNFGRTIRRRWLVGAPVNASCRTSRCTTHDSGTVWFAIPFPFGIFNFYSL
jgi:hypothetical protein